MKKKEILKLNKKELIAESIELLDLIGWEGFNYDFETIKKAKKWELLEFVLYRYGYI